MEVIREKDIVRIRGIEGFSPAEYASSVHGSQARILEGIGEPLSYDDLICYSGFAFRVGISDRMCPSAAHPCCGYQCVRGSTNAIPWRLDLYERLPWEDAKDDPEVFRAKVNRAVAASIDRGIPVLYGGEEDGLIVGYADGGERWRCLHPYHKWGGEEFWHDEAEGFAGGSWPWAVVIWREPKPESELLSDGVLLENALRQAVDMWTAPKQEDQYLCGDSAYSFWLDWLAGVDSGAVGDPRSGMQGNGWCYDVLIHSRGIAGRWLGWKAEELGGEAGRHLHLAAEHYDELAGVLSEGIEDAWSLALPPQKFDEWTTVMRRDQTERLKRARNHDRDAISAIQGALELI
ncbi:MAG: hypothetical protein JXA64_03210 [Candidatus Fermentibacteraceae bacterium]|nr:hypothetical protein [Candidatus Fermentibacteraceae bacterium]MBN2608100.1 hypothetical protein [Candidatus Fermentibacteraceae bacterium]